MFQSSQKIYRHRSELGTEIVIALSVVDREPRPIRGACKASAYILARGVRTEAMRRGEYEVDLNTNRVSPYYHVIVAPKTYDLGR